MRRLDIVPVGGALAVLAIVSYVGCILWGLALPQWQMHQHWEMFLPGFHWLTWTSFLLGLPEVIAYAVYATIVFVPTYNYLLRRDREAGVTP